MNRFFRSAFFPLIVIAALLFLGYRTLDGGKSVKKVELWQVIAWAERGQLSNVVFKPTAQEIDATHGTTSIAVNYPTDQAATEFFNLLRNKHIKFDSTGVGGSPWWSLLTGLLPFVLLIGF